MGRPPKAEKTEIARVITEELVSEPEMMDISMPELDDSLNVTVLCPELAELEASFKGDQIHPMDKFSNKVRGWTVGKY